MDLRPALTIHRVLGHAGLHCETLAEQKGQMSLALKEASWFKMQSPPFICPCPDVTNISPSAEATNGTTQPCT